MSQRNKIGETLLITAVKSKFIPPAVILILLKAGADGHARQCNEKHPPA